MLCVGVVLAGVCMRVAGCCLVGCRVAVCVYVVYDVLWLRGCGACVVMLCGCGVCDVVCWGCTVVVVTVGALGDVTPFVGVGCLTVCD